MSGDVGIEEIVGEETTKNPFDVERFRQADKAASSMMSGYMNDSRTIRTAIDTMNQKVRKEAAKQRSNVKIVQTVLEWYDTLLNRDAVEINNRFQQSVDDILRESESTQKGIARRITKKTRERERFLDQLAGLKEEYETFEFARKGYGMQIDEIDKLIASNRNGGSVDDVVLKASPHEYKALTVRGLQKNRAKIESKLLNAETDLQTRYSKAEMLGVKIESVQKSLDYARSQFTKALRNRDNQLKQQINNFAQDYIEALVTEAEIAENEEKMEEVITKRNKVAGVLYQEMADNSDLFIDGYQADYGDTTHITDAKKTLDEAIGIQIKSSKEGKELQRTGAKAVFEKYLG